MQDIAPIMWVGTPTAVTTDDTAKEFQRQRLWSGGTITLTSFQLVAGNTGPGGTVGSYTKIRISKGAYNASLAFVEVSVAQGTNIGVAVTGSIKLLSGNTLYAWIHDATGGHGDIELIMGGNG